MGLAGVEVESQAFDKTPSAAPAFVPLHFKAHPPCTLAQFFMGRVPKQGEVVELVAYEVTDTEISMAWRVVGETATKPNPAERVA